VRSTLGLICSADAPVTSRANATFSRAVRFFRRRKSWNTIPSRRRSAGISRVLILSEAYPEIRTVPAVGRSSIVTSLTSVVLPAPDGPVTNMNSPLRRWNETSCSA